MSVGLTNSNPVETLILREALNSSNLPCGPLFLETASKVALLWAQNVIKCPCYMVSESGDMELRALDMEVKFRHACIERCFKWLIACNIAC